MTVFVFLEKRVYKGRLGFRFGSVGFGVVTKYHIHGMDEDVEVEQQQQQQQQQQLFFEPFPRNSSTLLVAPSCSGKSYFLKVILENSRLYFRDVITRVIVVNGNPKIRFYDLENTNIQVVQFTWPDFENWDYESQLEEGDVVILDDLSNFNTSARKLVNQLSHHLNLNHIFLVVHSLLQQKTYEILNFVHSVLCFMQCSAVVRLCSYIVQTFYKDIELRDFVKKIVAGCEKEKTTLLLEINSLSVDKSAKHIAVSHLLSLANRPPKLSYAVVYPYPMENYAYENATGVSFGDNSNSIDSLTGSASHDFPVNLIEGSFVILNNASVATWKKNDVKEEAAAAADCLPLRTEEAVWNQTILDIEQRIENYLPSVKWLLGKNLLREILTNPDVCILKDKKHMIIYDNYKLKVSILDFILEATKKNFPTAIAAKPLHYSQKRHTHLSGEYQLYRIYVKSLISHSAPKMLFKNKLLLPY